ANKLTEKKHRVALLWHGDREARETADLNTNHLRGAAASLRAVGVEAEPAVYCDDFAEEVREQLLSVDGVLVWVNPIEHGHDRTVLDALLRQVADEGVFVSAHPDVILKMGTKEVLFQARDMSWGTDTHLYTTLEEFREQLPRRLEEGKPRVLKQYRGNGGNGVWKVERHPSDPAHVRVRHALRGSIEQDVPLDEFLVQCEAYFAGSGRIIDQAYQERLTEGMVRCYLVGNEVAGFGHQAINALYPAPPGGTPADAPQPGPRLYYPPTTLDYQAIKQKMEDEWLDALCQALAIEPRSLPLLWDADLLYGPRTASGEDTYVLCEINVSSVYPFPDSALEPLARATKERLSARRL
ncbi:MAG TPA: Cj0069 family protein, partial [Chthonomonadaceae bacterium]|nr:Cj0069 family protein [Chthonomonadaceae bacterium]